MFRAPADYDLAREEGRADPPPWYLGYVQAAQAAGVPPWEMVDGWTPRSFWRQAILLIENAQSAARKERDMLDAAKRAR